MQSVARPSCVNTERIPIYLASGNVHELARAACARGAEWLSAAEASRLYHLHAPLRRSQFLAGRWLARQTLSKAFGAKPANWALSAPDGGPPRVLPCAEFAQVATLSLSVSHSAEHVACALSRFPVGVDLEAPRRERDLQGIAALIGTPLELRRLDVEEKASYEKNFYAMWTLKEAWLKRSAQALSPARLARIQTRRAVAAEAVNAHLWRGRDYTLAVAGALPHAGIQWLLGPDLGESEAWQIEDIEPGRVAELTDLA
jgi:4'-phosphopantetheinyl transferase